MAGPDFVLYISCELSAWLNTLFTNSVEINQDMNIQIKQCGNLLWIGSILAGKMHGNKTRISKSHSITEHIKWGAQTLLEILVKPGLLPVELI